MNPASPPSTLAGPPQGHLLDVNLLLAAIWANHPGKSEEVTDHYLADLAALHGARLATLDKNITHPSVEVIA